LHVSSVEVVNRLLNCGFVLSGDFGEPGKGERPISSEEQSFNYLFEFGFGRRGLVRAGEFGLGV